MDVTDSMFPKRVAVLVLACASGPYDELIDAIRRTWGARRVAGVDVYYVYGNPEPGRPSEVLAGLLGHDPPTVADDAVYHSGDVLVAGCADTIGAQEDCLLRKRLIAFDYLTQRDRYDVIYTVCAASYVDLDALRRRVESLPSNRLLSGPVAVDVTGTGPFVSGSSMLLTADVAKTLARNADDIIEQNPYGFRDDVTIGHWVATRLSSVPVEQIIDDIHQARPLSPEHVIGRADGSSANYVHTPTNDQHLVARAYHYHFESRRADDIDRFHARHFGHVARRTSPDPTPIKYVQILGERCSGTNYLARLVDKNFEDVALTSSYGGKHWFIKDLEPRGRANNSTDHECERPLTDADDTLFLVIFRHPLDWIRSLHARPYHAPGHWVLPFAEFIRKPWVSSENARVNPTWPEDEEGHYFIEEADNALQLRTQKIRHLANLQTAVPNVAYINYESLLAGLGDLERIADSYGIRLAARPLLDESTYFGRHQGQEFTGPHEYAPISDDDLDFIRQNLDPDLEASLGYQL